MAHEQLNRLMANLPSFKLVEMKNITLDSHQQDIPATMTSYNYRDSSDREIDGFVINILKDGRVYTIEYSAEPETYSRNLPILLGMVNTFEVTQTPYTTMVIPASSNFRSYENGTMGIRIEYPENWIYKEEKDAVTFDFNGGHVRVTVFPSDYASSQQAAEITADDLMQSFSDFNLIMSEQRKFGGANFTSSNMLVYTLNNDLGSINKEMEIRTVHGGKDYLILYGADLAIYPILEPTVQKMINSFQITDRPDTIAAGSPTPTLTPLSSKFDQTYNFNLENGSILPIKYQISGGELTDVILEESRELDGDPTLVASITPTAPKGILLIELPRSLIDSKASSSDQPFYEYKWDGMKSGKYKEIENNQWTRTLEIPFAISISGIGESTHLTVVGTEPKL